MTQSSAIHPAAPSRSPPPPLPSDSLHLLLQSTIAPRSFWFIFLAATSWPAVPASCTCPSFPHLLFHHHLSQLEPLTASSYASLGRLFVLKLVTSMGASADVSSSHFVVVSSNSDSLICPRPSCF
jgi:hypothetical protein